ncbi:MAG: STAS domain-containing protein [Verrucomicrobia bacterium]|nr:STAS domain-containing protein [Verrucomicrobiota bacterium]
MITGLSIAIEQNGDKRILRLEGRVDAQTLTSLQKEIDSLFEKMHTKILLDFSKVVAVSDETLQFIYSETKKFKEVKGRLGLSSISSKVMNTIKNAGLEQLLLIYPNEQEALRAMA